MTHDTITCGIARGTSLLRHVDGIELPVAGTWCAPGSHATISLLAPRRLRQPKGLTARALEATLAFSADPSEVLVAVLFDAPGLPKDGSTEVGPTNHLEARSVPGPRRWALSGEVFAGAGVLPVRAGLAYHGVWRRGDLAYGWFTLAGTIGPDAESTWRRLEITIDILAYGPTAARPAPSRPSSIRTVSQTGDAA